MMSRNCNSFVAPSACGNARTLAFLLATNKIEKCKNLTVSDQHKYFVQYLSGNDDNCDTDFKNYKQNINVWKKNFQRSSKDNCSGRKFYNNLFHPDNWLTLSASNKKKHQVNNCNVCSVHHMKEQALFAVLANKYVKAANKNPYHASSGVQIKSNGKLCEITRDVYNEVNKSFKKITGIEFNEALVTVKELKLTKKKSKLQRKRELQQKYHQQKKTQEEQLRPTAVLR